MEAAQRVGALATARAKACPLKWGQSAFGANGRVIARRRIQDLRQSLCAGISGDKEDATLAIGSRLVLSGVNVATCLSLARSALRADGQGLSQEQKDSAAQIEAFRSGAGAQQVQQVAQVLPALATAPLVPIPSNHGFTFQWQGVPADMVSKVSAWVSASKTSNLPHCLDQLWAETHELLVEDAAAPVADRNHADNECKRVGMCLCSEDGRRLRAFRNCFLQAMKRVFAVGSTQRARLLEGYVVAHIVHEPSADEAKQDDPESEKGLHLWLHIGLMFLSPYRPTFMVVECVAGVSECGPDDMRTYVKAGGGLACQPSDFTCVFRESAGPTPDLIQCHTM